MDRKRKFDSVNNGISGDAFLQNPCVRNCCLNEHDICLGCGRTLEEILNWSCAAEAEKHEILRKSQERLLAKRC
ncbi:DUF1289 domain-containing protein [Vibrio vulnificus]|uniref:DUF1289 domain-containing protein n=1 Tax=Vibrio vulnificus TaxID=672 RepID=UPI0031343AB5